MSQPILHGKVWKFGDDINTDIICPGPFLGSINNPEDFRKAAMAGLDPRFYEKISKGDVIVAGKYFGCGSSRETAPIALMKAGVAGVVADSFARIFLRNAIAKGFPVVECPGISGKFEEGDEIEVDIEKGSIKNLTRGKVCVGSKLEGTFLEIMKSGGIIPWAEKIYLKRDRDRKERSGG